MYQSRPRYKHNLYYPIASINIWEINNVSFFNHKCMWDQIFKRFKGHHRVIKWRSYKQHVLQILYTKFQCNRPLDSAEQDCLKFLPYKGAMASWSCDLDHLICNLSFYPAGLRMKFGFCWPCGFWENHVWNCLTSRVLEQRSKNDLGFLYLKILIYTFKSRNTLNIIT